MTITTTADVHFRIDQATKEQSEQILDQIGISMADLFNMTLKRLIRTKDIPFETSVSEDDAPASPARHIATRAELDAYLDELAAAESSESYRPAEEVFSRLAKRFA